MSPCKKNKYRLILAGEIVYRIFTQLEGHDSIGGNMITSKNKMQTPDWDGGAVSQTEL